MPRNMSFALTTAQFCDRTKTVTRRKGWLSVKVGDIINACVKCQGLKPGEKIERLGQIRVVSVRRESLSQVTNHEATLEGFPDLRGCEFAEMFCNHMGGDTWQTVTRIEFEYIDG